ncbi:MAG: hypothetical protein AAFQ04_12780, partial [Pseudomonadota bacterium]
QISDLVAKYDAKESAIEKVQAQASQRIDTLEAELKRAEKAQDKVARLERRIETLEAELDKSKTATTDAKNAVDTRDTRIRELLDQLDAARNSADDAKADLGLALRSQMMLQSDLRVLQNKYQETEKTRQTQQELLTALTPRLQQAMEQLRGLALPQAQPEADALLLSEEAKAAAKPTRRRTTAGKTATAKTAAAGTTTRKPARKTASKAK